MKTREKRKAKKKAEDWDIDDDEIEGFREWDLQEKLNSDRYSSRLIKRFPNAEYFDLRFFQKYGFSVPLYFQDKKGLGIKMPQAGFSVDDVKRCVGARRLVDVVDVRTQKALTMPMGEWAKYYNSPKRDRLLNVISLEFSHTKLGNYVDPPNVVRQLDWVERVWPSYLRDLQKEATNDLAVMKYPKVRKYALMSVRGAYTDFHVDFGGTSVWYHIFRGAKVFWMVPPTEENLRVFGEWSVSGKQGEVFFPDLVTDCECIHLAEGTTFFIPPGWIHGVYTPDDSLVFGGNYLHTYGGRIQLRIWELEEDTHVKLKYRYPFYKQLHWYVIAKYVEALMKKKYTLSAAEVEEEEKIKEEPKEEIKQEPTDVNSEVVSSLQRAADHTRELQLKTEALGSQTSRTWVHLTKYEVENLQAIVTWLRSLHEEERDVPRDVSNPFQLLKDTQLLVNLHREDDFFGKAITGVSVLEDRKSRGFIGPVRNVKKEVKKKAVKKEEKPNIRRRIRCQRCEPCRRDNCKQCVFCRDMVKFGGPGHLRKSCVMKSCIAPQLPNCIVCDICNLMERGKQPLLDLYECSICGSIVHPKCLYVRSKREGVDLTVVKVSPCTDLPNYWECPLCIWEGREGRSKSRVPRGVQMLKTMESDAVAMGMRHTSKRAASGDAFARMVAMTNPHTVVKKLRTDAINSEHSYSAPVVVVTSPKRPEPKSEFQISTVSCLENYVDHEEVIGGGESPAKSSQSPPKMFVVPAYEPIPSFEEQFVARTSSRGEVERPKRFIEEG